MGDFTDEATVIRALPFVGGDRILVADSDMYRKTWLRNAVSGMFGLEEVDNARDALDRLTGDPPRVFVVGSDLVDVSGGVLLAHAARYGLLGRSEERRVGKECEVPCRSRWSPYH